MFELLLLSCRLRRLIDCGVHQGGCSGYGKTYLQKNVRCLCLFMKHVSCDFTSAVAMQILFRARGKDSIIYLQDFPCAVVTFGHLLHADCDPFWGRFISDFAIFCIERIVWICDGVIVVKDILRVGIFEAAGNSQEVGRVGKNVQDLVAWPKRIRIGDKVCLIA